MSDTEQKNQTQEQAAQQEVAEQTTEAAKPDLAEENKKLTHQLMVLAADYDNYRKRVTKDMEEASKFAITKFAKDLIDVLENLHRAESSIDVTQLETNNTLKQIFTGVELTKKSLIDIFERYGIVRIDPMGEQFNHDFHQAIAQIPTSHHAPGTVVQVIQAGYTLHGRLIRPALIAVAKPEEPKS